MATLASIIGLTFFLFNALISVRNVKLDEQPMAVSKNTGNFPIVLPNKLENDGQSPNNKYYVNADGNQRCLLYIESVSVILFDQKEKKSAWANFGYFSNDAKFEGSIQCPPNQAYGTSFSINLKISSNGGTPGYFVGDKDKDPNRAVFTANSADIDLTFNFTQPTYWSLVDASASQISLKDGEAKQVPANVDSNWRLASGISSGGKNWREGLSCDISGYKNYSFACSRTSPIVWAREGDMNYAVGIAFHNMQLQLVSTIHEDTKNRKLAKFGWQVSDCAPLFSIGTWMGLIVALLLIAVLSFGFLMLNSVQTMDRFDDPKQKQLVINAKE